MYVIVKRVCLPIFIQLVVVFSCAFIYIFLKYSSYNWNIERNNKLDPNSNFILYFLIPERCWFNVLVVFMAVFCDDVYILNPQNQLRHLEQTLFIAFDHITQVCAWTLCVIFHCKTVIVSEPWMRTGHRVVIDSEMVTVAQVTEGNSPWRQTDSHLLLTDGPAYSPCGAQTFSFTHWQIMHMQLIHICISLVWPVAVSFLLKHYTPRRFEFTLCYESTWMELQVQKHGPGGGFLLRLRSGGNNRLSRPQWTSGCIETKGGRGYFGSPAGKRIAPGKPSVERSERQTSWTIRRQAGGKTDLPLLDIYRGAPIVRKIYRVKWSFEVKRGLKKVFDDVVGACVWSGRLKIN